MQNECAFDLVGGCSALKEKKCEGCHFFKTKEEVLEGRAKADERVNQLDLGLQQCIRHKYYGGFRRYRDG